MARYSPFGKKMTATDKKMQEKDIPQDLEKRLLAYKRKHNNKSNKR